MYFPQCIFCRTDCSECESYEHCDHPKQRYEIDKEIWQRESMGIDVGDFVSIRFGKNKNRVATVVGANKFGWDLVATILLDKVIYMYPFDDLIRVNLSSKEEEEE